MIDFIVVGSGPSGVHAAQTLLEKGNRVFMLDVGIQDSRNYASTAPDQSFLSIRRQDPLQASYFLGDSCEGVSLSQLQPGAGLSTPRQYVTSGVDQWAPSTHETSGFRQVESLARGGLGGAWGLGCFVMSPSELSHMGLHEGQLKQSYQTIADRIGISGQDDDDGSPIYKRGLQGLLPSLEMDEAAKSLLTRYERNRAAFHERRIFLGKTLLALLSQDRDGRRACQYHDMDFWSDHGDAAYRPAITLKKLQNHPNFTYQPDALVTHYTGESGNPVHVHYVDLTSCEKKSVIGRRLLLAAGTFGTSRIVLRSTAPHAKLPLLCNPYFYTLCLRPKMLGRPIEDRRHSMGQLVMAYDENGDGSHVPIASLLGYRSLLLYRLIKEAPLPMRESRAILQSLQSALTIAGVFHPDAPVNPGVASASREVSFLADPSQITGDRLRVICNLNAQETTRIRRSQAVIQSSLRMLGCYPLRTINPGLGASIHYGGTLPFSSTPTTLATEPQSGRLHGAPEVYIADGSPFRFLPAKGITLTLMAYADWVAQQACKP